jgi:hypothetical protein
MEHNIDDTMNVTAIAYVEIRTRNRISKFNRLCGTIVLGLLVDVATGIVRVVSYDENLKLNLILNIAALVRSNDFVSFPLSSQAKVVKEVRVEKEERLLHPRRHLNHDRQRQACR